jgi:hypothetical protein
MTSQLDRRPEQAQRSSGMTPVAAIVYEMPELRCACSGLRTAWNFSKAVPLKILENSECFDT